MSQELYFTTFPYPAPSPQSLNSTASNSGNAPRIRPQPHMGAPLGPSAPSPDDDAIYYYFTIDDQLLYTSFYQDWGPLNLAMVYKACLLIHGLLKDEDLSAHRLVLYSSDDPRRKANAALLMALYMLIVHNYTPWRCFQPISELEFMSFRDAGRGPSTFNLSIHDCLWGFWKGIQNRLIDLDVFDLQDYEFYEKVENGDWNWITPNFIAFASPRDYAWTKQRNEIETATAIAVPASPVRPGVASPPKSPRKLALQRKLNSAFCNCLDYFEKHKVDLVVRLNAELYDKQLFLDRGIKHLDLCFEDGSNPSDEIVRTFIDVADAVIEGGGVVAVHCKAGLGRTGCLIGAYLIWKYGFTASEAIAFMRIVRPGCVVGPQQHYMHQMQLQWAKWAAADEIRRVQAAAVAATAHVVTPATPPAEQDEVMHETRSLTPPAAPLPLPPVTPGRAVIAARTRETPPPGQPRKTPMAKRVAIESDEEDVEMDDTLPALGAAPPVARPRARTTTRVSGARGTASEQRPTRVLRSSATSVHQKTTAARSSRAAAPPPNKIPRLAGGSAARSTAAARGPGAPSARRVPQPPSPTPSRLPTLTKKHNPAHTLAELPTTRSGKPESWMKAGASAIVMPPSKSSQRPGPRPVRRRRSSFSAADVVA
ncbi:protein-tyrosine phosphatase-like protein [Suillus tomentosus]|nr:protein-tyrosine phosphatase-like protein [Suillus tomentosus]